jgi:hypothetical protein
MAQPDFNGKQLTESNLANTRVLSTDADGVLQWVDMSGGGGGGAVSSVNGDVGAVTCGEIRSDAENGTGANSVLNIITLSQSNYDSLPVKATTTLYVIVG